MQSNLISAKDLDSHFKLLFSGTERINATFNELDTRLSNTFTFPLSSSWVRLPLFNIDLGLNLAKGRTMWAVIQIVGYLQRSFPGRCAYRFAFFVRVFFIFGCLVILVHFASRLHFYSKLVTVSSLSYGRRIAMDMLNVQAQHPR